MPSHLEYPVWWHFEIAPFPQGTEALSRSANTLVSSEPGLEFFWFPKDSVSHHVPEQCQFLWHLYHGSNTYMVLVHSSNRFLQFYRKNGWFYIICKISRNILSKIEVEMLIILVIDEKHSWIYYENNDEICDFTDDIKEINKNEWYVH